MAQRLVLARRRHAIVTTAVGVALATLASFTHPFTWSADTVVALAYAVALTLAWSRRATVVHPAATPALLAEQVTLWRRTRAWIALAVVTVTWEILCLVAHPRRDHPTMSSLINQFDRSNVSRGLFFVAWLALGLTLVST